MIYNGKYTIDQLREMVLKAIHSRHYGHVQTRYNNTGGRLAGAGVKTIFESQYFNASLTYSWATNRSKLLTATDKENKMLYFEISASCC